jgi:hypothetical protein
VMKTRPVDPAALSAIQRNLWKRVTWSCVRNVKLGVMKYV